MSVREPVSLNGPSGGVVTTNCVRNRGSGGGSGLRNQPATPVARATAAAAPHDIADRQPAE